MSQKRQQEDGKAWSEGSGYEDRRSKRMSLRNVVLEVMCLRKVQLYMEPVLEPLVRRVVKEEVDLAVRKYITNMKWNCRKELQSSEARSLQLQFLHKISLPVFTGARIEGEDCSTLKVALVDALTGQVVQSGPESFSKVEIVVLEGDFDGDEGGCWTSEEFKSNMVREREGKKPILTGDALFNLKDGIGMVGEISFTDNSSWTRSRKFRLGARVMDHFDGMIIKEARTESFIVRDHRGELYKKHYPPSLHDEVWRLEKIGKDGAFHKRLSKEKINTVKDFLLLLYIDPLKLKNILGTGMSAKMWEATVDHARTCTLDPELYFYRPQKSQQKTGVIFNVVGQVVGLVSDCQFVHFDKLSDAEKVEAHDLVLAAFQNGEDLVTFEDEALLMDGLSHKLSHDPYSNSDMMETSDVCETLTSQNIDGFDYQQGSACSSDNIAPIFSMGFDDLGLTYDQQLNFPGQLANSLICDTESFTRAFCDEHISYFDASEVSIQPQNTCLESQADLQSVVNPYIMARPGFCAQKRWTILYMVLKWFSIGKAKKRTPVRKMQRFR
ncbi:hypothetical protein NMG60_11019364 [Bertholletia excelsa]